MEMRITSDDKISDTKISSNKDEHEFHQAVCIVIMTKEGERVLLGKFIIVVEKWMHCKFLLNSIGKHVGNKKNCQCRIEFETSTNKFKPLFNSSLNGRDEAEQQNRKKNVGMV